MTAVIYARYSSDNQREKARFANVLPMQRKTALP